MIKIIIGRLLQLIPVLWILLTLTFFLSKAAPGGPFSAERQATPEVIQRLNEYYGLDKPLWQQYLGYIQKVVRLDFGPSYSYQTETVNEVIARAFPISLQIGTLALGIALVIGITAGTIAAMNKNKWLDYLPMTLAMAGICVPTFVMGPILALFFGLNLNLAPVSGWYGLDYTPLPPLVLPAVTLGLFYAAYIARLTRGGMLDILNQDFIRTARAKGVPTLPNHFQTCHERGAYAGGLFSGTGFCRTDYRLLCRRKSFQCPGVRSGIYQIGF